MLHVMLFPIIKAWYFLFLRTVIIVVNFIIIIVLSKMRSSHFIRENFLTIHKMSGK